MAAEEYDVLIRLTFQNIENPQELKEAVEMIMVPGLLNYRRNYGDIAGKPVAMQDPEVKVKVPPIQTLDKMTAARLLSRYMRQEDRQNGSYALRGKIGGSFFLVEGVLKGALKELKADHCFNFVLSNGRVLVQDIEGRVVHNFVEIPDKVMELAEWFLTLRDHYTQHAESLKTYDGLRVANAGEEQTESNISDTSYDVERAIRTDPQTIKIQTSDKMQQVAERLQMVSLGNQGNPVMLQPVEEDDEDPETNDNDF